MANIEGGPGNDLLRGSGASDLFHDPGGTNSVLGRGGNDMFGTRAQPLLGTNRISAGRGRDTIFSADGDDRVTDMGGDNLFFLGGGNNFVSSKKGDDRIFTGAGNDVVTDLGGDNRIATRGGDDLITTAKGADTISAGWGNDRISDRGGDNVIDAIGGNNTIRTGSGDDQITTGKGNDFVSTRGGSNTIDVGDGNNRVLGGRKFDDVTTGIGDDFIDVKGGDEDLNLTIQIGDIDLLRFFAFEVFVPVPPNGDLFKVEVPFDGLAFEDANAPNVILDRGGSDNLRAKGGDDLIISDSWDGQAKTLSLLGDDTIDSGSGDDLVIDRGGDNVIRTGAGDDAIFTSLIVDIPPGTLPDFPDGLSTSFTGDDSVVAGDGNDEVNTGAGDDTILGGTGDDTIYGGAGSDLIETGPDKDVVFLGDDADGDVLRYDGLDQVSTDANETDVIFQFSGPSGDQVDMTGIVDVDAGDKIVLLSADLGVGGDADDILVGVDLISDGLDGFDFFVAILADVSLGTIGIGNFPPADSFDDFIIL